MSRRGIADEVLTHRAGKATTGDAGFAALASQLQAGRTVPPEVIDKVLRASDRTPEALEDAVDALNERYRLTALAATLPAREARLAEARDVVELLDAQHTAETANHETARAEAVAIVEAAAAAVVEAKTAGEEG